MSVGLVVVLWHSWIILQPPNCVREALSLSPRRPPIRHALVEPLPHPPGSTQQDVGLALAPGGHALELLGYGLEEVAEP